MVTLWSLRLAAHLAVRVAGHHPVEDGRYRKLRQAWAPNVEPKLLGFFAAQGLLVAVLSVPFLIACLDPTPALRLSRLNTRPARAPVNASTPPSRSAPHDSGSVWVAKPFTV
jgi:hypothetical protein